MFEMMKWEADISVEGDSVSERWKDGMKEFYDAAINHPVNHLSQGCTFTFTSMFLCMHACVRVSACALVCVCLCACVHD